jgi:photosystem II stability/assembly factor-like uncharacterized protein
MRTIALLLLASAVDAQPRVNVRFQCAAEDLDAAGLSCTPAQPCAVFLELASVESVGGKIFLSGNLHSTSSTLSSVLLASDDGGRTWTEPHSRVRLAGLDQIQFIDFETGWVAGQTLQGTPRDPFLLVTRDGGKSWQVRPVLEESRVGAIETFWFDSKTTGALLIDRMQPTETGARHELYSSMTGGDSWSLEQVSAAPLKLRHPRPDQTNSDWRIRADAPSKSYHVEQRQADRWRTVAVAPIHITDCKTMESPPELPATAPPADTPPVHP